jgi:hypothetical protein
MSTIEFAFADLAAAHEKAVRILVGWQDVVVARAGSLYAVSGFWKGAKAATADPDVEVAANRLAMHPPDPSLRDDPELQGAQNIAEARAILRQRVQAEGFRRSGVSVQTLRRAAELSAIINDPTTTPEARRDASLEAEQFAEKAASAAPFEAVRAKKENEILELKTVEEVYAYDTLAGWPKV